MKRISKIVLSLAIVTGLWSCETDDNFMFVEPVAGDFVINTPENGSAIVLTEDMPQDNVAATFSWDAVEYTTPTEVTYEVQFAAAGTDFAEPMSMSTSTQRSYSITNAQLNAAALALDLVPEVASTIEVRVIATIGSTGSEPKISNVLSLVVTPYPSPVKRQLYLVGNATSADWSNDNNNFALWRDPENDNVYMYTGYFNAGEFKLLEMKGQWQPQWGQNGGAVAVNPGGGSDPGAFTIAAAGYYTFMIDLTPEAMTYSLTPYDASSAPTYTTVGVIGSATANGWDASTPMVQDANDPHKWYIYDVDLTTAKIKFRANDAWDVNWGGNTMISGVGTQGGADIDVEAGTYDIYFNDLDGRYLLVPQE